MPLRPPRIRLLSLAAGAHSSITLTVPAVPAFFRQSAFPVYPPLQGEYPAQQDAFNSIRGEFVDMLKGQIAKSNNGIERSKYITFGLPAGWLMAEARPVWIGSRPT